MPEHAKVTWPDVALAGALAAFGIGGTQGATQAQDLPEPVALTYALTAVAALSVALWRWRPWWTFIIAGGAFVAYIALGYAFGPMLVTGLVAVYGLTSRVALRPAILATVILLFASMEATAIRVETAADPDTSDYLTVPSWVVFPAAVGVAVRVRRESTRAVREAEARSTVSEERLRMAQEIHDTVGHGLAVIAMQAGVALHVLDREPGKARESLEAIRSASRHSLEDLRAELDALRGSADPSVPYRAAVGLADAPALADRIRSTGLPVSIDINDVNGGARLPPDVDLVAYRIVQESLTNVLRHAGPEATASVSVNSTDGGIVLEVSDDGVGVPDVGVDWPREGHGIVGMRQRVEALGGSLDAGPSASGGFVVTARIPVSGSDA